MVWWKQRKGRGLRSGQPCDCDCDCSLGPRLRPEVKGSALCQSLPAPARAQSPMKGGGGSQPAPGVEGELHTPRVPDKAGHWAPQPPVPTEVPVPSLPCPIRTDHTARVSASIFCSPWRFSSSCTCATFCLMAISGPPPYRVLK